MCIYYLVVWSSFNFLHNSQWVTYPIQPCLVLYYFSASFIHSLRDWLVVSSLPLTILLCIIDFGFDIICGYGVFWATVRWDSVYLQRFPYKFDTAFFYGTDKSAGVIEYHGLLACVRCVYFFIFSSFERFYPYRQPLMMTYEESESARDNFGKFIYQFHPETKTIIGKFERILNKLCTQSLSL